MTFKPILVAFLAIVVSGAAQAQYQMVSPMLYHGPVISYRDHVNAQKAPKAADRVAPGGAVDPAAMAYRPDPVRRRSNLAQFVAKTRAVDPAGADDLEKLFAQTDFIAAIGQAMAKQGLRLDNLADAYATWWVTAWQATAAITTMSALPR